MVFIYWPAVTAYRLIIPALLNALLYDVMTWLTTRRQIVPGQEQLTITTMWSLMMHQGCGIHTSLGRTPLA